MIGKSTEGLKPQMVQKLQALEVACSELGMDDLYLTSAYRDPKHNEKVGGAKNSMHLKGLAVDVAVPKNKQKEFVELAKKSGFKGIGANPDKGFVHVDLGRSRTWSYGDDKAKNYAQRTGSPGAGNLQATDPAFPADGGNKEILAALKTLRRKTGALSREYAYQNRALASVMAEGRGF